MEIIVTQFSFFIPHTFLYSILNFINTNVYLAMKFCLIKILLGLCVLSFNNNRHIYPNRFYNKKNGLLRRITTIIVGPMPAPQQPPTFRKFDDHLGDGYNEM